ncbi:MAG: PAS domain S-box protein [Acidobacteria bacterium]|nr:PAS domain S-box protein [Acidobacteriota bacterium]
MGMSSGPAKSLAAEPLLSLAVTVTSEQRVESVLQSIVQGLASLPGVALARIWLLPSVHLPSFYDVVSDSPDCLCLVASAGSPINSPGQDWSFLQGHFAKVPFNVGKVGQVAASRRPILVEDVAVQNDWIVRPDWAKREEIRSFAGHPLIFRDKLLGVIAVFSRQFLGRQEFTWLGLFANQAALAIANACAEEALRSSERNLVSLVNTKAFLDRVFARVPEAIVLLDRDDRVLQVNPEFTRVFGYAQEEACGRLINELIVPEDLLAEAEEYTRLGLRGESVDVETVRKQKDGTRIHVSIVSGPVSVEGSQIAEYVIYRDITERKRAEQKIRENEANQRQVIDTIPTLAWCNLPDGPNEFTSRRWNEYTGLSPEESRGWGWQVAFHPEDLPPLLKRWQQLLVSGEAGEIEARIRRLDGVYRWFLIRVAPFRDETGKIHRWYGTSTDIEDRKKAEEAQRATESNLVTIVNTIPTAAWTARPDGYCDFLNQVWLDYAGMTAEQAEGWGWAEAIYPDDRPKLVKEWQLCLASGTPVDTEARIRRFDSSYRWFLIRGNPLKDESGNILKWYGTCVDIEDRKRGEEALRTREVSWRQIVDNIPGLVATTGAMGEVEFLNRQTLEYFGKTTEELKNWALIDAVHTDDLPSVVEARKRSIETGQIYEIEHRCRRADGIYRWFQVRGLPVRDAENKVTAWYLLLTDIEDRERAEEAVRVRELDARSLLDNIPGFLGRHSPDGTPEIVNRTFLQYQGKTLEEIGQWRTSDLVHPDDLAHVIEVFGNGISEGQPWGLEFRLRRFDGVYRWFETRWVPVRDVEGRILHWNALTTDIDDRKKAEGALQSSERNLNLMINAIPTYIHVLRADASVLYVNQAVMDYFGITK